MHLIDNRRDIGLERGVVAGALPEHFTKYYPKLVAFLDAYYEFLDGEGHERGLGADHNFDHLIGAMIKAHDVQAVDLDKLEFAMADLTMGIDYSESLSDARLKAQLFGKWYRNKGSLYSLETFFRWMYGEDVTVEYGKNKVFYLNHQPSQLGPASLRYIKNDKLYQTFALLIKVGVPISAWRDTYKLFAHPAGMYFEAQVVVESTVDLALRNMTTVVAAEDLDVKIGDTATMSLGAFSSVTGLYPDGADSDSDLDRVEFNTQISDIDSATTISLLATQYESIAELTSANSPTFDEFRVGDHAIDFSNSIETMDEDKFD